jgi:hypothetical protein
VAGLRARVADRPAGFDEAPAVAVGSQREQQDAEHARDAGLAVGAEVVAERGEAVAAGADDELADAADRIGGPVGGLCGERSYWWLWPLRTTSAPAAYRARQNESVSSAWAARPDVKRGRCQ